MRRNNHFKLSCEEEEERSEAGRDVMLSPLLRWLCRAF